MNCLGVFGHFVGLALKVLKSMKNYLKNTPEGAQRTKLCTEADSEPCQTCRWSFWQIYLAAFNRQLFS